MHISSLRDTMKAGSEGAGRSRRRYAVVSDGEIYVNGVDGSYTQPWIYVFTMPDANVQLKVYVIADPNGAGDGMLLVPAKEGLYNSAVRTEECGRSETSAISMRIMNLGGT